MHTCRIKRCKNVQIRKLLNVRVYYDLRTFTVHDTAQNSADNIRIQVR